jgi:nucleotide-binding universal stress UspA family protein
MQNTTTRPLFKRILCPIDLHGDFLPTLRLGRRLAERNGAALSLIYVMTPSVPGGVVLRQERESARGALAKMVEADLDGIEYELIVQWGNPAKEILAAEARMGAELCIMPGGGTLGSSRLFRSTVEKVARRSSCPVLIFGREAPRANGFQAGNSTTG